jgi:hypothetical protein
MLSNQFVLDSHLQRDYIIAHNHVTIFLATVNMTLGFHFFAKLESFVAYLHEWASYSLKRY